MKTKVVTNIKFDISGYGNEPFAIYGSPLFETSVFEDIKKVEDYHMKNGKKMTVYQRMVDEGFDKEKPEYWPLGSGSDFGAMYHYIGKLH